jgi:gas vesicle protein
MTTTIDAPLNLKLQNTSDHRQRLDAVVDLKKSHDNLKSSLDALEQKTNAKINSLVNIHADIDAKISQLSTDIVNVKDEIFDSIESYVVSNETPREANLMQHVNDLIKRIEALEANSNATKETPKKFFKIKN